MVDERDLFWTENVHKPVAIPPAGFDDLSVKEQIDYVQSLWDRIVTTFHGIEELRERLTDCEANPEQPWQFTSSPI